MRNHEIRELRKKILLCALASGGGHIASSYSSLEILWTLYCEGVLNVRPAEPCWEERDRFVLSKGHAALGLYVCLAKAGFFPEAELWTFARPNSRLGGEPMDGIPGVEVATGSLGHGLSYGVGLALGMKKRGQQAETYVLVGDGECQEGSIWEAAGCASALRLDNLTAILDCNGLQKMDTVDRIYGNPNWKERWGSFGWQIAEVNGNDVDELLKAFAAPHEQGKPKLILANTIKGYGVSVMENAVNWHYRLPNKKEMKVCMAELNITQEEIDYAKGLY